MSREPRLYRDGADEKRRAAEIAALVENERVARVVCPSCNGLAVTCPTCDGWGVACPTCRGARLVLTAFANEGSEYVHREVVKCPTCHDGSGVHRAHLATLAIKRTVEAA